MKHTIKKEITELSDKEIDWVQNKWEKAGRMREFVAEYNNRNNDKKSITLKVAGADIMPPRVAYMFGIQWGIEFARSQDAHDRAGTDAILSGIKHAIGTSIETETLN